MTCYKICTVCKITVDGSSKIHQIANRFSICQSCRKIYYSMWRKIFELLFVKIYQYFKQHNLLNSVNASPSSNYSSLVSSLDISIITEMIYEILNSDIFTDECLSKQKFEELDSYKTCLIHASDYAINVRNTALKRKQTSKKIDPKLNKKCGFCRFKFMALNFKEVPRMKLIFQELSKYSMGEILFFKSLEDRSKGKNKSKQPELSLVQNLDQNITVYTNCLVMLYVKKIEFIDGLMKINLLNKQHPTLATNLRKTSASSIPMEFPCNSVSSENQTVILGSVQNGDFSESMPAVKKVKNENENQFRPLSLSNDTEYISTSEMEIIQPNSPTSIILKQTLEHLKNFSHPGEYNSPYDIKMTIKNIFVIFNNFKKILNEGFKFQSHNWCNKRAMNPQELLPLMSTAVDQTTGYLNQNCTL